MGESACVNVCVCVCGNSAAGHPCPKKQVTCKTGRRMHGESVRQAKCSLLHARC